MINSYAKELGILKEKRYKIYRTGYEKRHDGGCGGQASGSDL